MGRLAKPFSGHYSCIGIIAFVVATKLFQSAPLRAETDAWGSQAQSLGNAGVAWGDSTFAAFFNPARLTQHDAQTLNVGWGLSAQINNFLPIKNVVIESDYASDQLRMGEVDTNYRNIINQAVGANYLIAPQWKKLSVGVTASIPVLQLAYLDTGETLTPEYVLYRSRPQRPRIHAAVAIEPVEGFSVGAGVQLGFSLTSRGTVFLQSGQNHPSTMRFIASMKPKASPYLGLAYQSREKKFTSGAVARMPLKYSNYLDLQAGARAFGNSLVGLDFNFVGTSAFYYDPMSIEWGASVLYTPQTRFIAQIDYERWTEYQPPAIVISSVSSGIAVSPGIALAPPTRDIFVPRVGHEVYLAEGKYVARAGYFYRPSIFRSLPTGTGNYLDPDRHGVTAGFGFKFQTLLGHSVPWEIDLHGQYQSLVQQVIRKTGGDELGQGSGDLKVGAPGYDAGGKAYAGGASVSFAL